MAALRVGRRGSVGVVGAMARLEIVLEGDPRLRRKANRVRQVDAGTRRLAEDMRETMLEAPGLGLAAPQVGVPLRLIVVHVPDDYDEETPGVDLTLVNPELVKGQGRQVGPEGCLSVPGWVADVPRFASITVKGMDLNNRDVRIKAKGILARILQHEIDHLDGILYLDRIEDRSTLRRVPDDEDEGAPAA